MKNSLLKPKSKNTYFLIFLSLIVGFAICKSALSLIGVYRSVFNHANIVVAAISIIFIIGAAFVLFACHKIINNNYKTENVYLFSVIFLGVIYLFLFPVGTIPDEAAHIGSSYYLSNFLCCPIKQFKADGIVFRTQDFLMFQTRIDSGKSNMVSINLFFRIIKDFKFFDSSDGYLTYAKVFEKSAPLGYVSSAIGIAVARFLHLGFYPACYLGRLFNLASYIAITYCAIKIIPVYKNILFVAACLPMSLHLAPSFSYDGFVIAIMMLFVAYVIYLIKKEGTLSKGKIIICILLGVAVSISKPTYIPLVLIILLIDKNKFSQKKYVGVICKLSIIFVCILAFSALQIGNVSRALGSKQLSYVDEKSYTVSWAFSHIFETILIFIRTIFKNGYFYLYTMTGSGLGWLQITPGLLYWTPYIMFMCVAVLIDNETVNLSVFKRCFIWVLVLVCAALVLASMFFAWTPMSSNIIIGVQGRYFLPVLCPFLISLKFGKISIPKSFEKYFQVALLTFGYCYVISVINCIPA